MYHVYAGRYRFPILVTAVPLVSAGGTATLMYQTAIARGYLYVSVHGKSSDGDFPRVSRSYGVGIGIDVVFRHFLVGDYGLAHIGAETFVGAYEHFSRGIVDGQREYGVGEQWGITFREMMDFCRVVTVYHVKSRTLGAYPLPVCRVDGNAGNISATQQVVSQVTAVVPGHDDLCEHHGRGFVSL